MPVNYQLGKIYSIRSYLTDDVYYGATCETLAKRLYGHRRQFKRYQKGKGKARYSSFKLIEQPDHYIELVEMYACNNKAELHRREGQIIRANPCVNKRIEGRTDAEYQKQYYQLNAEKIKQKVKQYRQDNTEHVKQRDKQYRQLNAEKIKARKNQKHTCDCGGKYTQGSKARHLKSKKHQEFEAFMELTEEEVRAIFSIN